MQSKLLDCRLSTHELLWDFFDSAEKHWWGSGEVNIALTLEFSTCAGGVHAPPLSRWNS